MSESNVKGRVQAIFEKLDNISTSVQDEKNSRFHNISQLIMAFEAQLQHNSEQKEEKFNYLASRMRQLGEFLEQEQEDRLRQEAETQKLLTDLERHARKLIEQNSKDRVEQERKIVYQIGQQVDNLQGEVVKEGLVTKYNNIQAQSESYQFVDAYINEDLPKLADELQNEIGERKEVEGKIQIQFLQQLQDLKEAFDREKKEREIKEEEIVESLREISGRITEALKKTRTEREKTEETLVQLVEKVVEKIKREMLEMNL
ncbi:unnamed protein product (macronuclear) [Paramecium tetraurelia]|uniref:Uncharacterized protein n=1 Tax=Paramecium tetraurelia TaxID=5888 RepID=A0CN18_PARTE|nr:uncharacterized protein GSPATT00008626001 [Paramecium tetraurelia]CAK72185.1 unnamed protein product [Paramecium tetraurelia]|eukprot:XP_001439582.1 hypothetical protein (macronuclear) [Paramecium tetraurelia strain d4-2]